MPQGQLFVISAPSGAGKTSLVAAAIERVSELAVSVSHTTRSPRPSEVDGRDYHFIDQSEFDMLITSKAFFEYAQVFGNFYGTSKQAIESQLASGLDVILEIDWQGALQLRMKAPDTVSIFILPPTRDALRERLIDRQQDNPTIIDLRMAEADETLKQAPHFDYWVINDDFEIALGQLKSIVISHRQRRPQIQAKHPNFLEKLLGHQ